MFMRISVSRRAVSASVSLLLVGGAALCSASPVRADAYLVGAQLFAATGTGATAYQFYETDTNSSNGITNLEVTSNGVTNGQAISFALPNGSNTLSFAEQYGTSMSYYGGTNGDLGLFFSSDNTPYDPTSGARTPDLLVSRATDGSTDFFFPATGTSINSYNYGGLTTYGGATSFTLGADPITVTDYSVNDVGNGTVTIQVGAVSAATPEPGSVALLVGMGLSGVGLTARRKRRSKTA